MSANPHHYRNREEYQLARALLADVCLATRDIGVSPTAAHRLRRSAVALPQVFLPTSPKMTPSEERDSQRDLLQQLADALGDALSSGLVEPGMAERLEQRRRDLLHRVNQ